MSHINPSLLVQEVNINDDDLKLKTPFCSSISGCSQSGKSEMLFNFVKYREDVFTTKFHRIIYSEPHSLSTKNNNFFIRLQNEFPQIERCFGLPNLVQLNLTHNTLPCLLLIDDQMNEVLSSDEMLNSATKNVHHFNLTVFFTMQNYFQANRYRQAFVKNCQYRFFFYNRIDQRELNLISSQIANSPKFLASNFEFLYKKYPNVHSHYLLIDGQFSSRINDFWCRTFIFPQTKGGIIQPIIFLKNPNYHK
jgi:hypothetical protein